MLKCCASISVKENKNVKTVSVVLNPEDNGGESVTLSVDFHSDDGKIITNTFLETQCYGVSASRIALYGVDFTRLSEAVKLIEKEYFMKKP